MPANVVKTKSDEKKWDRAKGIVSEEYPGKKSSDEDSYYALTNHIYQNMKKGSIKEAMRRDINARVLEKTAARPLEWLFTPIGKGLHKATQGIGRMGRGLMGLFGGGGGQAAKAVLPRGKGLISGSMKAMSPGSMSFEELGRMAKNMPEKDLRSAISRWQQHGAMMGINPQTASPQELIQHATNNPLIRRQTPIRPVMNDPRFNARIMPAIKESSVDAKTIAAALGLGGLGAGAIWGLNKLFPSPKGWNLLDRYEQEGVIPHPYNLEKYNKGEKMWKGIG